MERNPTRLPLQPSYPCLRAKESVLSVPLACFTNLPSVPGWGHGLPPRASMAFRVSVKAAPFRAPLPFGHGQYVRLAGWWFRGRQPVSRKRLAPRPLHEMAVTISPSGRAGRPAVVVCHRAALPHAHWGWWSRQWASWGCNMPAVRWQVPRVEALWRLCSFGCCFFSGALKALCRKGFYRESPPI
jgi:hypothetical protein